MSTKRSQGPIRKSQNLPVKAQRDGALLTDIRGLILRAREGVARAVNAGLVTLYGHVGRRIRRDILREKRAEYGERIVYAVRAEYTIGLDTSSAHPAD